MAAPHILRQEVWTQMEDLERVLSELPGVNGEEVAAAAKRAGNSSHGKPDRPRVDDPIGTARYATDMLRMLAGVVAEQEERIRKLESKK